MADEEAEAYELTAQLSLLSNLAASGAPRRRILESASDPRFILGRALERVNRLVFEAGFSFSEALNFVSQRQASAGHRSVLQRFARAVTFGVPDADHLQRERRDLEAAYRLKYGRASVVLKQLIDAYGAVLVSGTVIMVVLLVTSLMYQLKGISISQVAGFLIALFLIFTHRVARTLPSELVWTRSPAQPALLWALRLFGGALLCGALLASLYVGSWGIGAAFFFIGLSIIPVGFLALRAEQERRVVDVATVPFLRLLGEMAEAMRRPIPEVLSRLDLTLVDRGLAGPLQRLMLRLKLNLGFERSWQRMADETGSGLLEHAVGSFTRSVRLGTPAAEAATLCADHVEMLNQLRDQHASRTAAFPILVLVLHSFAVFLLVFMLQSVQHFAFEIAQVVTISLSSLASKGVGFMPRNWFPPIVNTDPYQLIVVGYLSVLTLTNGLIPRFARGSHPLTICFYLGLSMTITGAALLFVPALAAQVFTFTSAGVK